MPPQQSPEPRRERFTVVAEAITGEVEAWHITVRELPETWTVAFSPTEFETAGRRRIALEEADRAGPAVWPGRRDAR
jgi:hypothetical protein